MCDDAEKTDQPGQGNSADPGACLSQESCFQAFGPCPGEASYMGFGSPGLRQDRSGHQLPGEARAPLPLVPDRRRGCRPGDLESNAKETFKNAVELTRILSNPEGKLPPKRKERDQSTRENSGEARITWEEESIRICHHLVSKEGVE